MIWQIFLKKVSINQYLLWFRERMRWRWQRFWNRLHIFLKSKFIDLLWVLKLSHQYQIILEHGVRFFAYRKLAYRKRVNKSKWYSEKKIGHYQIKRLKKIVSHSYEHVPYYGRLFDSHGIKINEIDSIDQLSRIPILHKEFVKSNLIDFHARNLGTYEYHKFRTSGSTGTPLELFVDKKLHTFALSLTWRDFHSVGYTFNKRCVTLIHPIGFEEGNINRKDLWKFYKLSNVLDINTSMLEGENIVTILKKIEEFNPDFIKTYPSFAYPLSQYLQKHKTISIKPKAIITGSEKLYPEQKDFMQKIFGLPIAVPMATYILPLNWAYWRSYKTAKDVRKGKLESLSARPCTIIQCLYCDMQREIMVILKIQNVHVEESQRY
jgi:hypothetical protein